MKKLFSILAAVGFVLSANALQSDERIRLVERYHDRREPREQAERDLAAAAGTDPIEVIVYCPRKTMQLKEAAVPVRRSGRGLKPLTAYRKEFPSLGQLVESYRNLWKLYVFVPGRAGQDLRAAISAELRLGVRDHNLGRPPVRRDPREARAGLEAA